MKIVAQWALAILMYMLMYTGAEEGLWPMVAHFHHHDWQMPNAIEMIVGAVLLPFTVALLLTATSRLRLSPWPFLMAPLLLTTLSKYLADAFYPPFWTEVSEDLIVGGIQGTSACAGWFLYDRLSRRVNVEKIRPQDLAGRRASGR